MFEPLGETIRHRRIARKLSQEALARLARVSRRHLALLEKDEANVSLGILIRIARALELTELAVGGLCLRAAPPELTAQLEVMDAVAAARRAVAETTATLAAIDARLNDSTRLLDDVIGRALSSAGDGRAIIDAALRLEKEGAASVGETLRDLSAPSRLSIPPIRRKPAAAKTAARKRAR
ncbi:MAG TPA: helix-turn-helix transcriptional regulator [Thermoanaerobaculia bacterium]|jgi:transcriptional regulator with XRE-family HTH domain|nr:helix-turn-helix transcriptional regulator [Thermoanaerobaculia bacterium]